MNGGWRPPPRRSVFSAQISTGRLVSWAFRWFECPSKQRNDIMRKNSIVITLAFVAIASGALAAQPPQTQPPAQPPATTPAAGTTYKPEFEGLKPEAQPKTDPPAPGEGYV